MLHKINKWQVAFYLPMKIKKIVAAFRGMHVLPAKHSYVWLRRKCDYPTNRQTLEKVIPMCCYASQATQLVTPNSKCNSKFELRKVPHRDHSVHLSDFTFAQNEIDHDHLTQLNAVSGHLFANRCYGRQLNACIVQLKYVKGQCHSMVI